MEFKSHTKYTQDWRVSAHRGFLALRTQADLTGSRQNSPRPPHHVQGLILLSALPWHNDMAPKPTLEGGDGYSEKSLKNSVVGWTELVCYWSPMMVAAGGLDS